MSSGATRNGGRLCADKPFGLMVSLRTARLLIVLGAATFCRLAGQELGNLLCLFKLWTECPSFDYARASVGICKAIQISVRVYVQKNSPD
eukprot:JP447174.1.p2 GENE.JP447174.1~~JP447174.1.p2  ORF type:complete len:90 (-),score=4.92 JP447174.1:222-491(-)